MANKYKSKADNSPLILPDTVEELQSLVSKLHADLEERTQQRDNLSRLVEELNADLDATEGDHAAVLHNLRIRQQWRSATEAFRQQAMKLMMSIPSPLDAQAFESDDWQRQQEIKQLIERLSKELDRMESSHMGAFIDGSVSERA